MNEHYDRGRRELEALFAADRLPETTQGLAFRSAFPVASAGAVLDSQLLRRVWATWDPVPVLTFIGGMNITASLLLSRADPPLDVRAPEAMVEEVKNACVPLDGPSFRLAALPRTLHGLPSAVIHIDSFMTDFGRVLDLAGEFAFQRPWTLLWTHARGRVQHAVFRELTAMASRAAAFPTLYGVAQFRFEPAVKPSHVIRRIRLAAEEVKAYRAVAFAGQTPAAGAFAGDGQIQAAYRDFWSAWREVGGHTPGGLGEASDVPDMAQEAGALRAMILTEADPRLGALSWIVPLTPWGSAGQGLPSLDQVHAFWSGLAEHCSTLTNFAGSETFAKVIVGDFEFASVRPLAVMASPDYDAFYKWEVKLAELDAHPLHEATEGGRPVPLGAGGEICHETRYSEVVERIGYLLAIAAKRHPGETIRWLDVGCGDGLIANAVEPGRYGEDFDFEVIGLELDPEKVAMAQSPGVRNRKFVVEDLRKLSPETLGGGFHLVTAFEVLEHLFDPLPFLRYCQTITRDFVVVGSPLRERVEPFPAQAHIWSFGVAGFEQLIRLAGLKPMITSATYVGKYRNNLDWLNIVGERLS